MFRRTFSVWSRWAWVMNFSAPFLSSKVISLNPPPPMEELLLMELFVISPGRILGGVLVAW